MKEFEETEKELSFEPTEQEYEKFAKIINEMASKGLIHSGTLCSPFFMPLEVVSPAKRTLLCFYPGTHYTTQELKKISDIFTFEAELGKPLDEF